MAAAYVGVRWMARAARPVSEGLEHRRVEEGAVLVGEAAVDRLVEGAELRVPIACPGARTHA